MKLQRVAHALGFILLAFGAILLLPALFAALIAEYHAIMPFITAAVIGCATGGICLAAGRTEKDFNRMKRTEGLLVVTLTWVGTALIGCLPYLFFGLSPVDAYFESVSGLTTTGATILTDFSIYPKSFFFWRSLTQWLGGMGIIVLFVAILPQFGVAGRKIFFAEAPGPTEEKITPRIAHTAKALWLIYILLTIIEICALELAGMPTFDAICNSLTTMAAGGFSPHPLSICGYENNLATWIITFFMLLAGTNFALQYRLFFTGRIRPLTGNEEFRFYVTVIAVAALISTPLLMHDRQQGVIDALRDGLFQVISIITTTGFSSTDFALWWVPTQAVLVAMMCIGGCAGSAGGGIKVVRVLFVWKFLKREIVQLIHPNAVLPIKLDKRTVPDDIQRQMLSFILFYILLMLISGLVASMIEQNESVGFIGTMATIGNIGPGFGEIGPMGTFGNLHIVTKIIFIADMIAGRLELIPILAMLNPEFWNVIRE